MTNFLLDLGSSFGWSCFLGSWQIVLTSFSISDLFFVFSLNVGGTSVFVMACVVFCVVVMLLIVVLIHVHIIMLCFYRGSLKNG